MPTDPAADTYTNAQLTSSEARLTVKLWRSTPWGGSSAPFVAPPQHTRVMRSATPRDTQFTPKALDRR